MKPATISGSASSRNYTKFAASGIGSSLGTYLPPGIGSISNGTSHTVSRGATDLITGKSVSVGGRYRADKRQANRRDLRRYRLRLR